MLDVRGGSFEGRSQRSEDVGWRCRWSAQRDGREECYGEVGELHVCLIVWVGDVDCLSGKSDR